MADLANVPSHDDEGNVHVVVESPQGSKVKLAYDPALRTIAFSRPLLLGIQYPYDWGFIPSTRAEDDDPLDAMVVFDAPTWPGVVIACRPIGIVLVTQRETEKAKRIPNHRIIAVPKDDERYAHVNELTKRMHRELERFFVAVGQMTHKEVEVHGWAGPKRARAEIEKSTRRYAKHGQKEVGS